MSSADLVGRKGPLGSLSGRITVLALGSALTLAVVLASILSLGTWRTLVWQEEQVLLQRTEALVSWVDPVPLDEDNLFHEVVENVFEPREILMRVEDPLIDGPIETPGFSETLRDWVSLNARSKFWGDDQRAAFQRDGAAPRAESPCFRAPAPGPAGGWWRTR